MRRAPIAVNCAVLMVVMGFAAIPWKVAAGAEEVVQKSEVATSLEAVVTIDPDAAGVPYSRMLFGGFIEHFHRQIYGGIFEPGSPLADKQGFRKDVIAAMKELKLSVVRWPGGCFASGYHWQDGVGDRKPVFDVVWGVEDPNTFGTDEFVRWCRLVGCEPYICTNAGNGTPEEMKQWVEYCNATAGPFAEMRKAGGHDEPLDVRYWSIGNENWGPHEIGHKTPERWGPLVSRSAELMSSVDDKLTLLAAATPNRDWTLPLLSHAGKDLDAVAIHEYWLRCHELNLTPDYLTSIVLSEGPEKTIQSVIDVIDQAGYRGRIKIAFDEWNLRGWHHPGFPRTQESQHASVSELIKRRDINANASQYTMADALFSASFLNACLRHADDVCMANIAPIVNTRGPLYVHPGGIVRRTTFHTLAMYANELEDHVGKVEIRAGNLEPIAETIDQMAAQFTERRDHFSADKIKNDTSQPIPIVDGIATVDESGNRWSIAIINRHPFEQVECTILMHDDLISGTYQATVLSGDSPDAFNSVEQPDRVVPEKIELEFVEGVVQLPAHSLTIIKLTGSH